MDKKLLTLDDLVKFCESSEFQTFSSKDTGYRLAVQIPGIFEITENDTRSMLFIKLKVCHTLLNRNGSYISEDNMKKAMPSLKYRPVLAHIHQLDNGEWDFEAHNMEIVKNEDDEDVIQYVEKQVGAFTVDEPYLEYDEKQDKTYVIAYAAIPEEYTKAADIIRRKDGTKVSCELYIESMSYNAKEKRLELEDFFFTGTTLLGSRENGKEIGEGMLGSRADIIDFSEKNNSLFADIDKNKLIEVLDKLNTTLSNFNINNVQKKGGNQMFEELLVKYNKTVEDIDFEYKDLSDEELESKFAEAFEKTEGENAKNGQSTGKERNVIFELSFDEIRQGLNALCSIYRNDDEWCYVQTVYNDYFIMCDWDSEKYYKQSYLKDGDNLSLSGERIQLFLIFVTESEKIALDEMKSNYSVIESELNTYKKAELDTQKEKIFEDESYSKYLETEEFKDLIKNKDNYSLDELKDKAEIAFAKCVKKSGSFAFVKESEKKIQKHSLISAKSKDRKPYGGIFNSK
ncbi:hypothetical protein [Clostridium sp.]|uniref:hypothetical protein n=1 Tax=Clostridium sp. TaxID=1506 RepID=UPI003217E661